MSHCENRSLNNYFIALFLFENELTREAKASVFFENKHFHVFLLEKKRKLVINTMFCT